MVALQRECSTLTIIILPTLKLNANPYEWWITSDDSSKRTTARLTHGCSPTEITQMTAAFFMLILVPPNPVHLYLYLRVSTV